MSLADAYCRCPPIERAEQASRIAMPRAYREAARDRPLCGWSTTRPPIWWCLHARVCERCHGVADAGLGSDCPAYHPATAIRKRTA